MALPLKPTVVVGLVNELRKARDRPLLLSGTPGLVPLLAKDLSAGGDAQAIRTGGAPEDVAALVHVVGDEVTEQDERVLKAARRAGVPIFVIAAGRETPKRIPFVLATNVIRVEAGHGFPVEEIARVLAHALGEEAAVLARHLPLVRHAVCEHLIESFARKNGLIGVAVFVPGADLPVLTINQLRMVLRICAAYGLDVDSQRVPEILTTIGAGFGFRALAREVLGFVPVAGWLLKGAIAYAGTRALGEAAVRYCEARTAGVTRLPA